MEFRGNIHQRRLPRKLCESRGQHPSQCAVAAGAAPVVENWSVTDGECVVVGIDKWICCLDCSQYGIHQDWRDGAIYVGANVPLEKIHQGAPREVLAALGLVEAGDHIDTTAYSKDICVNAFDMVTAPREVAHNTPVITMGKWSNIAEIAITLRLARYNVFNMENKIEIANRVRNCALDCLQRMGYLQRAFEEFKRRSALLSLPRLQNGGSGGQLQYDSCLFTGSHKEGVWFEYKGEMLVTGEKWTIVVEVNLTETDGR
ncbi:hypothetical protein LSTR_LSTR006626 [Laodelphax striatellus]|uniref:Uncharacterized protein n=1 Tax=Laodelphax striatellus TaxID=195883 RepID=A0A482X8G3_LAOST|nr:hypothetical protein LSTR_LSTR006626 [Laodelphax striatellus]